MHSGRIKYTNKQTHTSTLIKVYETGEVTAPLSNTLLRPPAGTFASVESCSVARQDSGPDRSMAHCPELCSQVPELKLPVPTCC